MNEEYWRQRWSSRGTRLKLTDEEFWDSTPALLNCLADRLVEERKRDDWNVALVMSTMVNTSTYRPKEGVKPEDYLPRYDDDEPVETTDVDRLKKVASVSLTGIIRGLYQRQERNKPGTK